MCMEWLRRMKQKQRREKVCSVCMKEEGGLSAGLGHKYRIYI